MTVFRCAALFLFLASWVVVRPARAANVIKRSSSPRFVLISATYSGEWTRGTRVCIGRNGRVLECGVVAKASAASAIVRLDNPNLNIVPGDQVRISDEGPNGRGHLRLGFMGGASLTGLGGDGAAGSSSRLGGILGPTLEIDLGAGGAGFVLRALYKERGSQVESGTTKTVLRIDYINLEPSIQFTLRPSDGRFYLSFGIGPYVGVLINAKGDITTGGTTVRGSLSSVVSSTDAGALVDVGGTYQISQSFGLRFDVQYAYGLLNIAKASGAPSTHTRSIDFTVGGVFTL